MDTNLIELIKDISETEKSFNEIQTRYRILAANCLIATFIGLGFCFTIDFNKIPIDRDIGGSIICFLGTIGILLIWNLDLMVYHRLLDAVFIEGIKLENKYEWLPQIRNNMMKLSGGKGVLKRIIWFYLLSAIALLTLCFLCLYLYIKSFSLIYILLLVTVYLLTIFILIKYVNRQTSNTDDLILKLEK